MDKNDTDAATADLDRAYQALADKFDYDTADHIETMIRAIIDLGPDITRGSRSLRP